MSHKNIEVSEIRRFVFVVPGENIANALYVVFCYNPDDPDSLEKNLRFMRRYRKDIPEGNVAVFVYDLEKDQYHYFKTIKNRRKSFALSCDSEQFNIGGI